MVKKLKYLLFLFIFFLIFDVNASTVGGIEADSPSFAVILSDYNNVPVRISTEDIFGEDIVNLGTVVNDYVYITACSDMPTLGYSYRPFYNNTTGETASATDIRYTGNLTSKTCTFNNGYQGKVVYLKFRLVHDLFNVGSSSAGTWLYNDYITLYIGTNKDFSFTIQNISSLDSDLDIYSNDFDVSLLEQQNQQIINNQNNNTNSIINNQDSNTQDIIDNQNSNTDKEIASQQVCNVYDNNSLDLFNRYLLLDGTEKSSTSGNYGISKYIPITSSSTIKVVTPYLESDGACFYNVNRSLISCVNLSSFQAGDSIPIPTNSSYFRFTIRIPDNRPRIEICSNGNQVLNDSVNNLNDTLNSEDTPNTNQDIQDMDDMVASDTPISDLITMPLTLINAYITGINSSCSPVNLGNLYGTDLILPCINLEQRLGSNLWSMIDIFFCIFMCYNIGMLFVSAFDGITSLRDDFEGLYQPRHADTGYQPRHGGGN